MGIAELAHAVGLHPNSARDQLRVLADVGLVVIDVAPPSGRGRPSFRYAAAPDTGESQPYRSLARALADEVARRPYAAEMAADAGERWGRGVVVGEPVRANGQDPVARLVGVLGEAGFAPDPVAPGDDEIRLRSCPFEPIEQRLLPVVCGVHLGFVRGVLAGAGSPRADVAVEPYVEPGLCVARLGSADTTGVAGPPAPPSRDEAAGHD